MASAAGDSGPSGSAGADRSRQTSFSEFVMLNKLPCLLFVLRLSTIVNGVLFFLPIWSSPVTSYRRAIVSYAAVSAFRLSERLSIERTDWRQLQGWISRALAEDSGHYLLYCLLFIWQPPNGICLISPVVFSFLHSTTFSKKIFQETGVQPSAMMRKLIAWVDERQQQFLITSANAEVILFPLSIFLVFVGGAAFYLPFLYYRFLRLRYQSQRNPYCKIVCQNFRTLFGQLAVHRNCPRFVTNLIYSGMRVGARLFPDS